MRKLYAALYTRRMQATWRDRITPTAIGLVSRAWVIDEVQQHADASDTERARLIDALCAYEPARRHGPRNNLIFWMSCLGLALLANTLGFPGWAGFGFGVIGFLWIARVLAVKTLRWHLRRLLSASLLQDWL